MLAIGGYVDIHSHLLPGIDDGPADMEGTLAMARAAAEAGTTTIAATPHLRADFPGVRVGEIASLCERVRAELAAAGIDLEVVSGGETSLAWAMDAPEDELRRVTYGQRGGDLLVETPSDVAMLDTLLFEVRRRGVRVTLAHPERSRVFQDDPGAVARLSAQGVLLQVNADALLAHRSSPTRQLAEHLCQAGLAHAVASDGHRGQGRRPVGVLAPGVEALGLLVGPERARWMSCEAPAAIIRGRELPPAPQIELQPRSRLPWRRPGRRL